MSHAEEFASSNTKRFEWSQLPPGEYKMINGKIVPVDRASDAADKVATGLRRLIETLETP